MKERVWEYEYGSNNLVIDFNEEIRCRVISVEYGKVKQLFFDKLNLFLIIFYSF